MYEKCKLCGAALTRPHQVLVPKLLSSPEDLTEEETAILVQALQDETPEEIQLCDRCVKRRSWQKQMMRETLQQAIPRYLRCLNWATFPKDILFSLDD
tara:strand:+ start:9303 stop:9596 length:294 start_codon:yes stop_codon:yes gene_type:complete